jgi:hypothetical protein
MHGYMVVRSEDGNPLGWGEFVQVAHGDRVALRLTLHFRDGSLDDETAVFTQRRVFQLVSDHHIQRGPFFAKPLDLLIQANGQVTNRTLQKDGSHKTETTHLDLPPDVANGIMGSLIANVSPTTPSFKLGWVAIVGNPRLIHVEISASGQGDFSCVASVRCKAAIFEIKPELGGVAGFVAPLIGKQPLNTYLWVVQGTAPAFVREVGQLAEDSPIVSIELAGTVFTYPHSAK